MSDRVCTICKHYGEETDTTHELDRQELFDEVGTPVSILLCQNHAVELFKSGQRRFLVSHYKILIDIISSDEVKFLEILEKTVKKNFDDIY